MSESNVSTKEQVFIALLLTGLLVAVALAPLQPKQRLLPFTLIFLVAVAYLYVLHLEWQNTIKLENQILEKIEGKEYDPSTENSLSWLYACIVEALKESRPLFQTLLRDRKPQVLAMYFRSVQAHLNPNWFCFTCGKQVRYAFKPLCDSFIDPLLDGNTWLSSFHVYCSGCMNIEDVETCIRLS